MKMNIVDHAEAKGLSARNGTKTRPKWPILLLLLLSVTIGAGGCTDYYTGSPAYGPGYAGGPYGPGYAGYGSYGPRYAGGPYGPGYAGSPGYVAAPGSVTVEIGDRPYYTRGAGYYVGRSYYVWRPGHWANRYGRRVWIHGHYVVR
jgi:hypothetical protein